MSDCFHLFKTWTDSPFLPPPLLSPPQKLVFSPPQKVLVFSPPHEHLVVSQPPQALWMPTSPQGKAPHLCLLLLPPENVLDWVGGEPAREPSPPVACNTRDVTSHHQQNPRKGKNTTTINKSNSTSDPCSCLLSRARIHPPWPTNISFVSISLL